MEKGSKAKLVYFRARGVCDRVRCLLAVLDIPFENVFLDSEEMQFFQEQIPFGLVPVLCLTFLLLFTALTPAYHKLVDVAESQGLTEKW